MSSSKQTNNQELTEEVRNYVDDLKAHANMERDKTSKTIADLMQWCEDNKNADPMVSGKTEAENPFAEKKRCSLV